MSPAESPHQGQESAEFHRPETDPELPSVLATGESPGAGDVDDLGRQIRELRKVRDMTLSDLAELTNKSIGFLSKVERNQAKPSVKALQDIGEALGVTMGWFFSSDGGIEGERQFIVRAENRRRLNYSSLVATDYLGLQDYLLSASLDGELVLGMSRYAPGASTGDDTYEHRGEEAGIVLSGVVQLSLGEEVYTLRAGDSFSFKSNNPHRYHNPGPDEAVVVWANTPITLRS